MLGVWKINTNQKGQEDTTLKQGESPETCPEDLQLIIHPFGNLPIPLQPPTLNSWE